MILAGTIGSPARKGMRTTAPVTSDIPLAGGVSARATEGPMCGIRAGAG